MPRPVPSVPLLLGICILEKLSKTLAKSQFRKTNFGGVNSYVRVSVPSDTDLFYSILSEIVSNTGTNDNTALHFPS